MKNLVLILMMVLATIACAQKQAESKVPEAAKTAFAKLNPSIAKVKWDKEESSYEVNFKNAAGKEESILFDAQGNVLETEVEIAITDLPDPAKAYLAQQFQKAKIREAAKLIDAKGSISYEAEIKGKDFIFDAQGKLKQ